MRPTTLPHSLRSIFQAPRPSPVTLTSRSPIAGFTSVTDEDEIGVDRRLPRPRIELRHQHAVTGRCDADVQVRRAAGVDDGDIRLITIAALGACHLSGAMSVVVLAPRVHRPPFDPGAWQRRASTG